MQEDCACRLEAPGVGEALGLVRGLRRLARRSRPLLVRPWRGSRDGVPEW